MKKPKKILPPGFNELRDAIQEGVAEELVEIRKEIKQMHDILKEIRDNTKRIAQGI